jgi:hypothetical protein
MKKLILLAGILLGIFIGLKVMGQNDLTPADLDHNDKAYTVMKRTYSLFKEDMIENRAKFEPYFTTPYNEYNVDKDGITLLCPSYDEYDGDYEDCIKAFNEETMPPIRSHKTSYELDWIYPCPRGGAFIVFKITDHVTSNVHAITVGYFNDLTIKSIRVSINVDQAPLELAIPSGETVYKSDK